MRPIPLITGHWFYPLDPDPDLITIEVIAQGLSNQGRYAGQTQGFLSVAQHSVHVSELMARNGHPEWQLEGLMHDASEAFLVDLPAPVKELWPTYRNAEDQLMELIWKKFDLEPDEVCWEAVKQADRDSYATEARDLFPRMSPEHEWTFYGPHEPDEKTLVPWAPTFARSRFLTIYYGLRARRGRTT